MRKKMLWKLCLLWDPDFEDDSQQGISKSWLLAKRTSFFCYFSLELRMPKFMIRRSRWRWYYRGPVGMLSCVHLSCQDYLSPEKHLVSMKNMLFTRRALESECRCSRWHPEEYKQHGVWCWWRQNRCRPFENHDSSSFFFSLWKISGKCAKFWSRD